MPSTLVPSRMTSPQVAAEIRSGSTIALSGFVISGVAQSLCEALVKRQAESGEPKNLTAIHAAGHTEEIGVDLLAKHGLLARIIGGHWGLMPNVRRLVAANEVEIHNWPQGVVIGSFRAAGSGEEGLRSKIGLGTFIDPRQLGGCVNPRSRAAGSLITLCGGEDEYLHYAKLKPDVAFIRGWSADRRGNISMRKEPLILCQDDIAMATRRNKGRVFCQVHEIEDRDFDANEVDIPGFLIDAVIVSDDPEKHHRHAATLAFEPALYSGAAPLPEEKPPLDLTRKWIGRRAAQSVRPGDLLNLGIGIPGDAVSAALAESGLLSEVISTLESGVVGGVGAGAQNFGVAYSPSSRISETRMFDLYHGGNLNVAIMGMAETDASGNVNVSQFGGRSVGCGGFVDITQSAQRVTFCSGFNGKGFVGSFADGRLEIQAEGQQQKFVETVGQITFSAEQARIRGQVVELVTERCVFRLGPTGWILTEIAPGLDLERDVVSQMGFLPEIAADLRTMDAAIFAD